MKQEYCNLRRQPNAVFPAEFNITPWLLRRAVEASTNFHCAAIIARVVISWGNGNFNPFMGALTAGGRAIGLWKNKNKSDVRPICLEGALRNGLPEVRERVLDLVNDH